MKTVDGIVVFATHEIDINGEVDRNDLRGFQYEKKTNSVVVYKEEELNEAKAVLNDIGAVFNVVSLTFPKSKRDKAKGIKYNSRSEAIEYIEKGKVPEHVRTNKLEKENAELKERLSRLERLIEKGGS